MWSNAVVSPGRGSVRSPAAELVALIASAFLGAESMLLLGRENDALPIRAALRRVGEAIAHIEPAALEAQR